MWSPPHRGDFAGDSPPSICLHIQALDTKRPNKIFFSDAVRPVGSALRVRAMLLSLGACTVRTCTAALVLRIRLYCVARLSSMAPRLYIVVAYTVWPPIQCGRLYSAAPLIRCGRLYSAAAYTVRPRLYGAGTAVTRETSRFPYKEREGPSPSPPCRSPAHIGFVSSFAIRMAIRQTSVCKPLNGH
jgi:hypothetical protein